MAVLVIALKHDLHSDAVVDHLSRHGVPIVRIDPTESCSLPTAIKIISEPTFQTSYDFECGQGFDPTLVTSVLCRFAINSLVQATESQHIERSSEAERIDCKAAQYTRNQRRIETLAALKVVRR